MNQTLRFKIYLQQFLAHLHRLYRGICPIATFDSTPIGKSLASVGWLLHISLVSRLPCGNAAACTVKNVTCHHLVQLGLGWVPKTIKISGTLRSEADTHTHNLTHTRTNSLSLSLSIYLPIYLYIYIILYYIILYYTILYIILYYIILYIYISVCVLTKKNT